MTTDEKPPPSQLPRHLLFALVAVGVFACLIVGGLVDTPRGEDLFGVGVFAGIGALIAYVITSD